MRIHFEDGSIFDCSLTDQCLIATGSLLENPQNKQGLVQVLRIPAMWAKLILVRCELVHVNHIVMTENGLKRVIKVDRNRSPGVN